MFKILIDKDKGDAKVFQRYAIADGDGNSVKPFKSEWATIKDGIFISCSMLSNPNIFMLEYGCRNDQAVILPDASVSQHVHVMLRIFINRKNMYSCLCTILKVRCGWDQLERSGLTGGKIRYDSLQRKDVQLLCSVICTFVALIRRNAAAAL